MAAATVSSLIEEDVSRSKKADEGSQNGSYSPLNSARSETRVSAKEGPVALQMVFRILEARGPRGTMALLQDVLESMKLVQAITGTGAAGAFVHANSYADTRGETFGVLTALSTILAFLSLILTVIVYVSLGLLNHEHMESVEGYLVHYWTTLAAIIGGSVASLILLVVAVVVDSFHTYSMTTSISLLVSTCLSLAFATVFWISSTKYVFSTTTPADSTSPPPSARDFREITALSETASRSESMTSVVSDQRRKNYPCDVMLLCR